MDMNPRRSCRNYDFFSQSVIYLLTLIATWFVTRMFYMFILSYLRIVSPQASEFY